MKDFFADIIIPLALPKLLTYKIPDSLKAKSEPGKRVMVQLGKRKIYTGIIKKVHSNIPEFDTKDIIAVLDEERIVTTAQFMLWDWISEYYACTHGEVYKAALPSGLKIESESVVMIVPSDVPHENLSEKEQFIVNIVFNNPGITIEQLRKKAKEIQANSTIKYLIEKKIIVLEENLSEKYSPKFESFVSLNPDVCDNEEQANLIFSQLANAPKQTDLLMTFFSLANPFGIKPKKSIAKSLLFRKVQSATAAFNALLNKGVFLVEEIEVGRLISEEGDVNDPSGLSQAQINAYNDINNYFKSLNAVLLHGVTSSGKTEIYVHLIKQFIDKGKTILYLLPEIALTSQIINRLRSVFGKRVGIYHSRFSDAERVETYMNVLKGNVYDIVLGVRSSVFLPFKNLGLIIVDEEHENTYKQYDPAPRYNCRDTIHVLAQIHNAKVLLGTATPSVETYYHASNKKFGLVELTSRFNDILMPSMQIVDMQDAAEKRQVNSHFSTILLDNINETVKNGEQVILFQNRRGFSPYIECNVCNYIPECFQCDVKLTYHKRNNQLVCHYCSHTIKMPVSCEKCGSRDIVTRGFGTEKIEDDLQIMLPDLKIRRMDLDTIRTRKAAEKIIYDFSSGLIDVLVGTQMLSKGLDFDNVGLVGILSADSMLNFPDFRAFERSFQLMAQVSGRAGRRQKQGKVIIQTRQPKHEIIKHVINNDYKEFFYNELVSRKEFKYPPFTRLIAIEVRHKTENTSVKAANKMAEYLLSHFGNRVLGPESPIISRIQSYFIQRIILKIERNIPYNKTRLIIYNAINYIKSIEGFKTVNIIVDVDPQ